MTFSLESLLPTGLLSLIPTKAEDIVGVFDVDFEPVFAIARPIKAAINEEATFFQHPLESTATRVDHIVFDPIQITLTLISAGVDYRSAYFEIKHLFRDQTQLIVQTRTDTFVNMYIKAMPHDETPDSFDAVIINLSLMETQIANTEVSFQPASPSDSDTKKRGQILPKDPNAAELGKSSTLARIFG